MNEIMNVCSARSAILKLSWEISPRSVWTLSSTLPTLNYNTAAAWLALSCAVVGK
jgi:hypothetical protein